MPDVTPKPLNELLTRSTVTLYVGPSNTSWIIHEKLLCHHSPFFRRIFYSRTNPTTSYGLPDDEDVPFRAFVSWLYATTLPAPRSENDLGLLYELYLMGEKWEIPSLMQDVVRVVREWYRDTDTYPGLRRVQYVYANTAEDSPMRKLLIHAVARQMVLGQGGLPKHWDKALRRDGMLAVDIIAAVQEWGLREEEVPDVREEPEMEEGLDEEVEQQEAEAQEAEAEIEGEGEEAEADGEEVEGDAEDEDNEAEPEAVKLEDEETVVESPAANDRRQSQAELKELKADKGGSDKAQSVKSAGSVRSESKKQDKQPLSPNKSAGKKERKESGFSPAMLKEMPNGIGAGDLGRQAVSVN